MIILVLLILIFFWKVFHNIIYLVAVPLAFSNKLPQRLLSKAIKFEFPPKFSWKRTFSKISCKRHQIGISTPPYPIISKKSRKKTDNVKKWKCVSLPLSKVPCIATPVKARKCSPSHHWRQISLMMMMMMMMVMIMMLTMMMMGWAMIYCDGKGLSISGLMKGGRSLGKHLDLILISSQKSRGFFLFFYFWLCFHEKSNLFSCWSLSMGNVILKVIRKHLNTFWFHLGKCVDIILISSQKSKENFFISCWSLSMGKIFKTKLLNIILIYGCGKASGSHFNPKVTRNNCFNNWFLVGRRRRKFNIILIYSCGKASGSHFHRDPKVTSTIYIWPLDQEREQFKSSKSQISTI